MDKKKRRRRILYILILVLVILIVPFYIRVKNNIQNNVYYDENKGEIESVVEKFISKSFNPGISDMDTSLIDSESRKYIEFFKERNSYRNSYLKDNGYSEDTYRYNSGLRFNVMKVAKYMAYTRVTDSYSIDYVKEGKEATGTNSYDVVLKKVDGKWKIYACVSDDMKADKYDSSRDIFDFVDGSMLDNHIEKSMKQNATDK